MTIDFVPPDFDVPTSYTSGHFYLGILDPSVVELDYDAVMSSKLNLRQVFGENHDWPRDTMTLVENNGDLIKHREEFDLRKAFAYTVLTTDKTKCIGCLYIDPSRVSDFDSEVYFWIRDDNLHIETEFYTAIQNWLDEVWPFNKIAWPGRQISWQQWGHTCRDCSLEDRS